ncbi:MAG: FtsX-like permease family protein [Alphaproteobacteria bacterium]
MAAPWSLPLGGDATDRFLPWIIGLMVFLAALALALALALGGAIARWEASQTGVLTVELPASARDTDGMIQRTVGLLAVLPGVQAAEALDAAHAEALLSPWLGGAVDALPLPILIDVRLAPGAALSAGAVRAALAGVAPEARIEDAGAWIAPLAETARTVQLVGYAIIALIALAGVATVVFTSTTGLAVHRDAILLLHLIGAEDGFIARQFQRQALLLGFAGGVAGLGLAIGAFVLVGRVAGRLEAPLLPRLVLDPLGWAILAGLPFAGALLAMLVARLTVARSLARLP